MNRCLLVLVGLVAMMGPTALTSGLAAEGPSPRTPGPQPDGSVILPNQWSLRPAGRQVEVGDFPAAIAVHPQGRYAVVLHCGYGPHELAVLDIDSRRLLSRTRLEESFQGLAFSNDGSLLWVSGGAAETLLRFRFVEGTLVPDGAVRLRNEKLRGIPCGIAVDSSGDTLYAANVWGHSVSHVRFAKDSAAPAVDELLLTDAAPAAAPAIPDAADPSITKRADALLERVVADAPHPWTCVVDERRKRLYVSLWAQATVAVIDTAEWKLLARIAVEDHPNEMVMSPDGTRLFVANGKGVISDSNRNGPRPGYDPDAPTPDHIGGLFDGTVSLIDLPDANDFERRMRSWTARAFACRPPRAETVFSADELEGHPIPVLEGTTSPITHVLYVIKENRTYDQVLGDMPEGRGDPTLCLFPENVTPNHHALAREFVLLDNFYVESEVSADGHEWTMGAYATDFVERHWPLSYGHNKRKKFTYPSEGHFEIARPAGGYLWDRAIAAGVSFRSYGEWVANGPTPNAPGTPKAKALEGLIDPLYRSFDQEYSDLKRADRFIAELSRFEALGEMPRLQVVRLPNDHTSGTTPGSLTPTAFVAENDLALGRVVEAVSRSKFWPTTAIFVVEDDAQNGSDHIDAHRTVALVISPWAQHGTVDSSLYSTSSMLRTIELILGLEPMSQFDAAALPMVRSFAKRAQASAYRCRPATVPLDARNAATTWGAAASLVMDFSKEDAADDLLLNEIVWRSVRGAAAPMPPPRRAAFVFAEEEEADDD